MNLQEKEGAATMPQAGPSLHFVWLEVSDLSRSRFFYGDKLGFSVDESNDAFIVASLGASSLYLAQGQPAAASMYLAIAVPDIDLLYQRLLARGVKAPTPTDEGWARYIELTDPDGYRLLLLTVDEVA